MTKIELRPDQAHVVSMMDKVMRSKYLSRVAVIGMFLNFRKVYIDEVIPEKTKAKKFSNHDYYQGLIRDYDGLREAFETFQRYNSGNKDDMVEAFITGNYITPVLFKKGQIVKISDGNNYVGFIHEDVIRGQEKQYVDVYSDSWFNKFLGEYHISKMEGIK